MAAALNHGPPDPNVNGPLYKITIPIQSHLPSVFKNNRLTGERPGIYYQDVRLTHMGAVCEGEDRSRLLKVYTISDLTVPDSDRVQERNFSSIAEYQQVLTKAQEATKKPALRKKIMGIFVNLENGMAKDYQVVLPATEDVYNIKTNLPRPIEELMMAEAPTTVRPLKLAGSIKMKDIRFDKNKNYSAWQSLSQMGINAVKWTIPETVLSRIFARYTLDCQETNGSNFHLKIEYIIPPIKNLKGKKISQDSLVILEKSGIPTFTLWRSSDHLSWHRSFPRVRTGGHRCMITWGKPETREMSPNSGYFPSHFVLKRISHDVMVRGYSGYEIFNLQQGYAWFENKARVYDHKHIPPLLFAEFEDFEAHVTVNINTFINTNYIKPDIFPHCSNREESSSDQRP